MLIDPHTATGTLTARRLAGAHPVVTMATAHPAKFPDAVERATGIRPALPEHLADLFERPERTETIPNDLATVEDYVARVSRVGLAPSEYADAGQARIAVLGWHEILGWVSACFEVASASPARTSAACLAPSRS